MQTMYVDKAGLADLAERLTLVYGVANSDRDLAEMSVPALKTPTVVNNNKVAENIARSDINHLATVHGRCFRAESKHVVNTLVLEVIAVLHEHYFAEADCNSDVAVLVIYKLSAEVFGIFVLGAYLLYKVAIFGNIRCGIACVDK